MEYRAKRYKISSPVRFFIFVLTVVMVFTMGVYAIFLNPTEAASATNTYKLITVRENDTLWSLAIEYGPENIDTMSVVNEICDTNDIEPNDVHAGDAIFVPIEINR